MESNVQRELPELSIGTDQFVVDVALSELRLKNDPLKTISFFYMKEHDNGYTFSYNTKKQTIAVPQDNKEEVIQVTIPSMISLDPERVAEKYDISICELPSRDRDLKTSEALIQERLRGFHTEVKIGDEYYVPDVERMELRSVVDPFKSISLLRLPFTNDGGKYLSLYHAPTRKLLPMLKEINPPPGTVQLLILPSEVWLDPVGAARKVGRDERFLLDRYPIQRTIEARLYPLDISLKLKTEEKQDLSKEQDLKQAQKPQRRKGNRL